MNTDSLIKFVVVCGCIFLALVIISSVFSGIMNSEGLQSLFDALQ